MNPEDLNQQVTQSDQPLPQPVQPVTPQQSVELPQNNFAEPMAKPPFPKWVIFSLIGVLIVLLGVGGWVGYRLFSSGDSSTNPLNEVTKKQDSGNNGLKISEYQIRDAGYGATLVTFYVENNTGRYIKELKQNLTNARKLDGSTYNPGDDGGYFVPYILPPGGKSIASVYLPEKITSVDIDATYQFDDGNFYTDFKIEDGGWASAMGKDGRLRAKLTNTGNKDLTRLNFDIYIDVLIWDKDGKPFVSEHAIETLSTSSTGFPAGSTIDIGFVPQYMDLAQYGRHEYLVFARLDK